VVNDELSVYKHFMYVL